MAERPEHVPRMKPADITDLARAVVQNRVYITNTEAGVASFELILSLALADAPESFIDEIGAIWEYLEKAAPRSINGLPMFFSCHFIAQDDLASFITQVGEFEAALGINNVEEPT